jgi:hypothetical protein
MALGVLLGMALEETCLMRGTVVFSETSSRGEDTVVNQ